MLSIRFVHDADFKDSWRYRCLARADVIIEQNGKDLATSLLCLTEAKPNLHAPGSSIREEALPFYAMRACHFLSMKIVASF
jgi:hypothetical protein